MNMAKISMGLVPIFVLKNGDDLLSTFDYYSRED